MPFEFEKTALPGVILVRARSFGDARGRFMETYRRSDFERAGLTDLFVQDNVSRSARRGILRGLHFQRAPHEQAKLVRCTRGRVYDVAVDIRKSSPTFGKYVAFEFSEDDSTALYVPRGFAHGYQTLTDDAEVTYKTTAEYAPTSESGLAWNDPDVGIPWPVKEPVLSDRDRAWPRLSALR